MAIGCPQSGNFELRVLRTSGAAGAGTPSMQHLGFPYPVGANHVSLASASMDDLPPIYSTMTSDATASMASMEDDGSFIPTRRLLSKEVRARKPQSLSFVLWTVSFSAEVHYDGLPAPRRTGFESIGEERCVQCQFFQLVLHPLWR